MKEYKPELIRMAHRIMARLSKLCRDLRVRCGDERVPWETLSVGRDGITERERTTVETPAILE
jgi:hypothetical protein